MRVPVQALFRQVQDFHVSASGVHRVGELLRALRDNAPQLDAENWARRVEVDVVCYPACKIDPLTRGIGVQK